MLKTTTARFMAKIIGADQDACWLWQGSCGGSGYGQFWVDGRLIPAHWFLLPNYPEPGFEACHTCDNKLCVNPSHVFIGTRSDNMLDCVNKGRLRPQNGLRKARMAVRRFHRGVNNHECKLTEAQAREAMACPRKYGAATALAKKFGVSLTVICDIRDGKRWVHLWRDSAPDKEAK